MATEEFAVKIKADTSEFKEGMSQVNQSMSKIRAVFANASAGIKDFGNSTEGTRAKLNYLNQSLDAQKSKTELIRSRYKQMAEQFGENSTQAQKLFNQLQYGEAAEKKLANQISQTSDKLKVQTSTMEKLKTSMSKMSETTGNIGSKLSSVGSTMTTRVTAPIAAGFGIAIKQASDLNETIGKTDVIFKDNATQVKSWADNAIKSMGLSKQTALDITSTYGDMGEGMGLASDEAAKMGETLTQRAADLSSFKNISIDIAKNALAGVFTGEGESLKSMGIIMNQTTLQQYAFSQGIKKKVQDMNQSEQAHLRYNFVLDASKNAEGDFQKTSGGTANSFRILKETLSNLSATLGQQLLPIITPIVQKITEMVQHFNGLGEGAQKAIIGIGAFLAVIGPVVSVVSSLVIAFKGITTAIGAIIEFLPAMSTAMEVLTGPVGWVVAGITALTGAIVYLWNTNEGFRNAVVGAWNFIQTTFTAVWSYITNFIQGVIPPIWNALAPMFQTVWQGIVTFLNVAWEGFSTAFSAIIEVLKAVWTAIAPVLSAVFSTVVGVLSGLWQTFQGAFTVVVEVIKVAWSAATSLISGVWSGIVNLVSSLWSGFGPIFSGVCDAIITVWNGITGTISNVWDGIVDGVISAWNGIKAPFQAVADWVGSIWSGIKSFFKLPHFTFSGSMNPIEWIKSGNLPHIGVEWYANGGIMTRPTAFGMNGLNPMVGGEAGPEAILPINRLFESMNDYFDSKLGDGNINIYMDSNLIAQYSYNKFNKNLGMSGKRVR